MREGKECSHARARVQANTNHIAHA